MFDAQGRLKVFENFGELVSLAGQLKDEILRCAKEKLCVALDEDDR